MDGRSHPPNSIRTPDIFGPFGEEDSQCSSQHQPYFRFPLLRNVRSIEIIFLQDDTSHWAVKRQRGRLDYFVEVLKEHIDDVNRKSLLEDLKVTVTDDAMAPSGAMINMYRAHGPRRPFEKFMFGLESLGALRGIKHVAFTGLPNWYAQCLQLCIQGKGGDVEETNWPLVRVKRRDPETRNLKYSWTTVRRWYQPLFNWVEFAERNGIDLPEGVNRFWADEFEG